MTEKYIVLDIWGTAEKWVNVVQGEAGARELKIKLVESGEEYDPTGLTARFYVSDGGGYNHFVDADINDGIISVIVPSGLAPGIAKAQVVLSDNDSGPLITVGLTLNVIPCTLEDAAEATDEWSPLIEALEKAEGAAEATDAANTAASAANAAAEAANEAADAANEAAESIADKVDTVDALPVYAMARSSDPTDCWQPTPGIAVPDTGPYVGMAVRAVWEEEWDASVPIWAFGGTEPVKPEGTYPAGAYILMWDGEAFQLQADMASVVPKADSSDALTVIPTVTLLCDTAGDLSYDLRRDGTGYWLNGDLGEAVRVVSDTAWQASGTAPKYGINIRGGTKPIKPAGTYPAGAYILMYDGGAFQVQADMAYTDERAEQAADEAAEAHAAQVRRTYQPAWKRTAGGCPVSVADAAEGADLSSLVLKGRTVVSGTPSPDAPVTITGVKPQTVAVTGKNLLAPQGVAQQVSSHGMTMTNNGDGTYTFNGTADGSGVPWFSYPHIINYPSGWYTLNPQGMKDDNGCMTTIYDVPTYYTARGNQPLIFYLDESKGPFGLGFQFAEDAVLENVTVKPMLTRGQESREFEPYRGETITPDEVELYGDAHTAGKNLIPTFRGTASVNGVTVKLNMDGSITLDGTATETTFINFPHMMIKAGTYTLSTGIVLPSGTFITLREGGASAKTLLAVYDTASSKTGAISYSGDAFVYFAVKAGTTLSNLTIYPQLEEGSEATAYEPYQGMTTALEDGDSLDLATGEVVRRWKRLELDGTEKWTIQSVNEYGITNFNTVLSDGGDFAKGCICTHYVTQYTVIANTHDRGIFLSNTHSLFIRETAYTTVEEFKAWLASQKEAGTPVTVLYKIAKSSIQPEVVSDGAHSLAQPEGEMVISTLGTRGETAEAVDTEALYTYRPDWDDVLNRLAESEVQQAEMQTALEQIQAKLAELTATE
ncbi:hypothetical protein DBY21_08275 [Candidatus Gastranaerophilales bacterium]|nr:MAG: hypothetical protein DBY21_08275 [Candidatus Gastranaerophilales bacterium]